MVIRISFLLLSTCIVAGVFFIAPLPIDANTDFLWYYTQTLALFWPVSLYDEVGQTRLLLTHLGQDTANYHFLPPAYPPWYYFLTAYLAFFDLETSARVWCFTNFVLLISSIFLIFRERGVLSVLLLSFASLLFMPTIGLMVVGQLSMPLLFGACLYTRGFKDQSPLACGIGLFIFSFKPHLGLPVLVACIAWLFIAERHFALRVFIRLALIFMTALGVSFVVEPLWPYTYLNALLKISQSEHNVLCDTCSSVSIQLARTLQLSKEYLWLLGLSLLFLALFLLIVFALRIKPNLSQTRFLSWALTLTLLTTPYARNYDYVLLLYPILNGIVFLKGMFPKVAIMISYTWFTVGMYLADRTMHGKLLWVGLIPILIALCEKEEEVKIS